MFVESATKSVRPAHIDDLTVPRLHCPEPVRIDDALGGHVDDLLMVWIEETGIFADKRQKIRESGFGQFAMLCHPDTDDPDRLLLAAQNIGAQYAVDDQYCDDESSGSVPALVAPRLARTLAALEPAYLVAPYAGQLDSALRADPVLVAMRSFMERAAWFATPTQIARLRHETAAMFVMMSAEAAWRMEGTTPAAWEYLAHRQVASFLPCLAMIDVVGGYELAPEIYASPPVRRATVIAASVTAIANDLYSVAKESVPDVGDFNLPLLLAAQNGCSLREGMALTASLHDALMKTFEESERALRRSASPLLRRYLAGLGAWISGSRKWHSSSARFRV